MPKPSQPRQSEIFREIEKVFLRGLQEDRAIEDLTTQVTVPRAWRVEGMILAKSPGIWVGNGVLQAAGRWSRSRGYALRLNRLLKDGKQVRAGEVVARFEGDARGILRWERTALNLCAYLSGIATSTDEMVARVERAWRGKGRPPAVKHTRKILPLYRDLVIYAVECGGGKRHRRDLASGILIKENHLLAAGGVEAAVRGARKRAGSQRGKPVEVEVRSLRELEEAVYCGVDGALLDHFTPAMVKRAIQLKQKKNFYIEISGNMTSRNIARYAIRGVDVISSGAITHSAPAMDLSLMLVRGRRG